MDSTNGLIKLADECLRIFEDFAKFAKKKNSTRRTGSTRKLLTNIELSVTSYSRLLQAWKLLMNGKMVRNQLLVETANDTLGDIRHWIRAARDALESRLYFRKLYLIGFITSKRKHFEKRLSEYLQNVLDKIKKLNQLNLHSIQPNSTADYQSGEPGMRWDVTQPYRNFCHFFEKLRPEEMTNLRCLALEKLWDHFLSWSDLIPGFHSKDGTAEDPGDGLLYTPEDIKRANALLKDLHQAWTNMEDYSSSPPPEKLPQMGMICLIVMGMEQRQLLEDFLDSRICDDDLPLSRARLQKDLRAQHQDYVGVFLSEQYRAKPRLWDEGHHAKMEDEEPLPLKYDKPLSHGSYGRVYRVRDFASGNVYALKQQVVGSQLSDNFRARKHLMDETERLKGLRHNHVVRLVKSYERADSFGLLLAPAATTDLNSLLNRYRFRASRPDQKRLRPIFLTAFGCLSQGLAYIHAKNIRHKDIKPSNILYEKAEGGNGEGRFLWADFGLAYDFSATGNSRTHSTKIYSRRYAAPEILVASMNPARTEQRASGTLLDFIAESAEPSKTSEASEPYEQNLSARKAEEISHGRETDIFSLGCVFLELLAALVSETLPMDHGRENAAYQMNNDKQHLINGNKIAAAFAVSDDALFCKNLPRLDEWSRKHSTRSNNEKHDAALVPLFALATKMISSKANDRPSIDVVISEFAATREEYFCRTCWAELPSEHKATELVRPPTAVKQQETITRRTGSEDPGSPKGVKEGALSKLRRSKTAILHLDSSPLGTQIVKIR